MKCYVNYYHKGTFKDQLVYKEQEVYVDLDLAHLKKLNAPIKLKLRKTATSIWLQVHTIFLLMHSHLRRSL